MTIDAGAIVDIGADVQYAKSLLEKIEKHLARHKHDFSEDGDQWRLNTIAHLRDAENSIEAAISRLRA